MKKTGTWKLRIVSLSLALIVCVHCLLPFGNQHFSVLPVNASDTFEDAIFVTTEDNNEAVELSVAAPMLLSDEEEPVVYNGSFGEQLLTMSTLTQAERLNAYEIYKQLAGYESNSGVLSFQLPKVEGLANNGIRKSAQLAKDAISRDYPEKFWMVGATSFYYWQNGKMEYKDLILDRYKPVEEYLDRFQDAVNTFEVKGKTRYEKVKMIHDTLCANNIYNLEGTYAHEAYSGLVSFESVCEGYAKAMKVICDREGIPCVLVSGISYTSTDAAGDGHMWNYVQMDDGKWYAVDVTWNDQDSGTYHDFFLVGSSTVPKHFTKMRFSESHVPSKEFTTTGYGEFVYPELSEEAYNPRQASVETKAPTPTETPVVTETPIPTQTPIVTETPTPTETPVVTETPIPTETPIVTETAVPTQTPIVTETPAPTETPAVTKIPVPTETPGEIYYYGDIDKNGKVTADDALAILKHVVKLQLIEGESAIVLADVFHDSVIDATDALETLKMVVKLKELELREN